MTANFTSFKRKEIINVVDGMKIGFVDDILFDAESAQVRAVVVFGKLRLFGLLGRGADLTILWNEIEKIGEDTILIRSDSLCTTEKKTKPNFFEQLFS